MEWCVTEKGGYFPMLRRGREGIPQGLKPAFVEALSAKAKASAYPEAKAKATRSCLRICFRREERAKLRSG